MTIRLKKNSFDLTSNYRTKNLILKFMVFYVDNADLTKFLSKTKILQNKKIYI